MDWQPVGDQLGSFGQVILTAARYAPGSAFTYARDQVAGAMVGSMVELNVLSKQVPPVPLDVRSGSSDTAHPITMKVPYEPGLADGWPNLRCRYESRARPAFAPESCASVVRGDSQGCEPVAVWTG